MFVRGPTPPNAELESVAEVLFPNAEGDTADKTDDDEGFPCHADKSRATHHSAGLLIPGPDRDEYYRLSGVEVTFLLSGPATIDATFAEQFPSLSAATSGSGFELRLLADRTPGGRVATRILPTGGHLAPIQPSDDEPAFGIDGHHAKDGKAIPPKKYSPGAKWTPTAPDIESVEILLTDVTRPASEPVAITLGLDRPKAFFYNFDIGLPTEDELLKEKFQAPCKGRRTDHDFKWLYGLMDRTNPNFKQWSEWLGAGRAFPAPVAPCPLTTLVPVSTCFQTVL